jgi:hypothetical protein
MESRRQELGKGTQQIPGNVAGPNSSGPEGKHPSHARRGVAAGHVAYASPLEFGPAAFSLEPYVSAFLRKRARSRMSDQAN